MPHALRVVLLLSTLAMNAAAVEWPSWRGPDGNAVAPEGDYPAVLDQTTLAWRVELPGAGSSTPVIWGDRVFLTASQGGDDLVCCYGLDGKQQWQVSVPGSHAPKHKNATGSNPSIVCNADYAVAYFKSGEVVCLTHGGEKLWQVNLQDKYAPDTLWWDLGTSPVLTSAGAVVAVIQEKNAFLVTLDLKTGQVVWKTDRVYQRPQESDQAYTTPAVVDIDGKETIVTWGADHLTGHDAKSGELLWDSAGFNPRNQGMWRAIASATVHNGVAYVPYGRGDYMAAVKLGGTGDITSSARIWDAQRVGADVPSPVVHDGKVYNLSDRGVITCLNAADGEKLWSEQLPRSNSNFFSSPLLAGGKLYCVRINGQAQVVSVEDGFKLLSQADLGDESVATPAPVKDGLLIRTRTSLSCYSTKTSLYAKSE